MIAKKNYFEVEVKKHINCCRAVNSILSVLLLYYKLILITASDVSSSFTFFPHFLFYAGADQHENVRHAVVCKRRGLTCVDEHTSSLFN